MAKELDDCLSAVAMASREAVSSSCSERLWESRVSVVDVVVVVVIGDEADAVAADEEVV